MESILQRAISAVREKFGSRDLVSPIPKDQVLQPQKKSPWGNFGRPQASPTPTPTPKVNYQHFNDRAGYDAAVAKMKARAQVTPQPTASPSPSPVAKYHPSTPKELQPLISEASKKYGVPEQQLSNLFFKESSYNPDVMYGKKNSRVGAQGIAQFMPATAEWVGTKYGQFDPLVPEQAIPASAYYLQYLYERFGSWPAAYAAYNAGEGNVRSAIRQGGAFPGALQYLPEETQQYVPAILGDEWTY